MNQKLQQLLDSIQQSAHLSDDEKNTLTKSVQEVDKEIEITNFKLDRTEKVKRTTAILLEETIGELEQKRKAVEAQNRDLEVESALERVRTVAMSMNKPDDMLDVCKNISLQLQSLGVKDIRNVQTAIFYEERGTYMNYEYYSKHDKTFITETTYTDHEIAKAFAAKMLKGKGEVSITLINGEEKVKEWLAYQKTTNVFIDTFLETASSLNYYWFSLGPVALGISTYVLLNEGEQGLFKRFLNVFELAYRRYLDIEKAIAQAKEAQLETSLERVRAQAMAMRTPEDLTGICEVLYTELHTLGFTEIRNAMINIHNDEKETFVNYDFSDEIGKSINQLAYNIHPVIEKQVKQMRSAGDAFSETHFKGKDLEDWKAFRKSIGEKDDPRIEQTDALYYYFYSIGTGSIGISTFNIIAEDKLNVLKRFRNVFNLSYQRYTDIALAAAQAQEAMIELALERVRARTMAMQHSDELSGTAALLFQEFKKLVQQDLIQTTIGIYNEAENLIEFRATDWSGSGAQIDRAVFGSMDEPTLLKPAVTAWRANARSLVVELTGKELEGWVNYRNKMTGITISGNESGGRRIVDIAFFSKGHLSLSSPLPLPEEAVKTLERFAAVFDGTYTRFLDLQKAEAQVREAKIEAALERTRTQSMIMQHSNELDNTLQVFHEQVLLLGINSAFSFLWLPDEEKEQHIFWAAWKEDLPAGQAGNNGTPEFKSKAITYPLDRNEPATAQCLIDWKSNEPVYSYAVPAEGVANYFAAWQELINGVEKLKPELFPGGLFYVEAFMKYGCFGVMLDVDLTEEEKKILGRFAIEFERTYTRFLDLKKAEAQAREAQIEASLERVRSRSMGMQKSEELKEVIQVVYEQFIHLNINVDHAGFVVDYKPKADWHFWIADQQEIPSKITHPYFDSVWANQFDDAKVKGIDFFATLLDFEEKNKFYQVLLNLIPGLSDEAKEFYFTCPGLAGSTVIFDNIGLYIENFAGIPYTDEENNTLMRFGKVFKQTYTRFLDLQKAEAQARQAKIEAAMEKVRSRAMAMQKPVELVEVAELLRKEMGMLGVEELETSSIYIHHEETQKTECWYAIKDYQHPEKELVSDHMNFDLNETKVGKQMLEFYNSGKKKISIPMQGDARKEWINYCAEHSKVLSGFYGDNIPDRTYHLYKFSNGYIGAASPGEISSESWDLLQRATSVFSLAYTRFSDLQNAEAQAREAQIELSLERVRAKTMAMHNSADVGATAAVMVEELKKLEIETIRCGIGIMHEPGDMEVWTISTDEKNKTDIIIGWLNMKMHPLLQGAFESWRNKNKSYSYDLKDDDLLSYYNAINKYPGYPIRYDTKSLPKLIHHNEFYFAEGTLFAFSIQQLTGEQRKIFKRFAAVFGQTYRRYLDLKKAEAQAKEAQVETALERVRSRTLAMQKSDELAETAAVLFRQLILLGIEPNRLYIGIIKDDEGHIEFWVTDEDGSKVSTQFTGDTNRNISMKKMYDAWKKEKKSLSIDMQGKELKDYFHYLADELNVPFKQGLSQKRRIQSIAFFGKGFIGIASPDEQPEETISLLERFAAVFNLTYTRFNDLKLAEAHAIQAEEDLIKLQTEKKRAEDALTELRATQTQLIQSEKMASLGELTAGIAHEIQNPLNFVNNFSEVSKELLEEMREAIEKGDTEDAKEIMNDVIQNLEKINHHGKRADGIVKGMLQHSRSSSATKEPTDINKLADEYLRLAYHGLRAKDKSFNATLKTDYDETIGNINIIPQDIGRVILNLITNAFYVVQTPQPPKGGVDHVPTVSVSTKKLNGKVEVKVSDNGTGIPKNIVDKIFQPFFTTKPTGQGTGLGLSLSYDIVKAHGGELKVETKEGEGSEFIIQLPIV